MVRQLLWEIILLINLTFLFWEARLVYFRMSFIYYLIWWFFLYYEGLVLFFRLDPNPVWVSVITWHFFQPRFHKSGIWNFVYLCRILVRTIGQTQACGTLVISILYYLFYITLGSIFYSNMNLNINNYKVKAFIL